jgi:hypothetical protein
MTEQKLIDTINALIDADVQAECPALKPKTSQGARSIGAEGYSIPRP